MNTWRVCQTRVSFTNLLLETICQTLFPSLWGNKTQKSKMSESMAIVSLAELWTITEIHRQLNSVLTLFPAHRCPSVKFFLKVLLIVYKMTRTHKHELIKPFNF